MRSHQTGSTGRIAAGKLNVPRMPVEWLDAGNWRLPSGKALAEFALQAGFLAPLLFKAGRLGESREASTPEQPASPNKQFAKGSNR
jgi:hypothetical protein